VDGTVDIMAVVSTAVADTVGIANSHYFTPYEAAPDAPGPFSFLNNKGFVVRLSDVSL
jgi:hypothetical protein